MDVDSSVNATLPRNYKHLAQLTNSSPKSAPQLKAGQPSSLTSRLNKSSNPLPLTETSHGQKRYENNGVDGDHLAWVGPPLKAAKSNPELAGPGSLMIGEDF